MSEILAGSTFSSFISRLYFFLPIQRAQIILSGVELQNLPWNAIYVKAEKSLSDDNLPSIIVDCDATVWLGCGGGITGLCKVSI